MPFFAIRTSLFAIQFFPFGGVRLSCEPADSIRPSFRPNFYGRTTIMRRSIQLDRAEALPVKTIHGSGLVYSARYR
jgi:hypothetical protein